MFEKYTHLIIQKISENFYEGRSKFFSRDNKSLLLIIFKLNYLKHNFCILIIHAVLRFLFLSLYHFLEIKFSNFSQTIHIFAEFTILIILHPIDAELTNT